jgi:peptide deformylase
MSILELVLFPDERLRVVCEPVKEVTDEIRDLLDSMAETMYDAPGIGLAAPQIGDLRRIIVVDCGSDAENEEERQPNLLKLINPEIIASRGSSKSEEGCLSIPEIRETVKRAEEVDLRALNENGEQVEIKATGLLAIALQHEIDHLNGVLFIDYLSKLKKQLIKTKLNRLRELAETR